MTGLIPPPPTHPGLSGTPHGTQVFRSLVAVLAFAVLAGAAPSGQSALARGLQKPSQSAPKDASRVTITFLPSGEMNAHVVTHTVRSRVIAHILAAEIDSYPLRRNPKLNCPYPGGDGIFGLAFWRGGTVFRFAAWCGVVLSLAKGSGRQWRFYGTPFVRTLARAVDTITRSKSPCHQVLDGHHLRLCRLAL